MRLIYAVALIGCLSLPVTAQAQEAARSETAREVVQMMGAVGQAKAVVADTAAAFAENLVMFAPNLRENQRDMAREAAQEEYLKAFNAHEAEFITGLADVYQELYTEAELQQLKAFYKTPMGEKLAQRQSDLMAKHLEVVRRIAKIASLEATMATHQRLATLAPDSSQ